MPRRALLMLLLVGLTALGGVLLAFENRPSLALLPGALVADRQADRQRASDTHRVAPQTEDGVRRRQDIVQQAKRKVIQSIALHRSGEEGQDVVAKVTKPDEPVRQLIMEVFKNAGVPVKLVEESLKDWTRGVNVLEIGRNWQEKGIDVPAVVRQAESQGLPVRQLLQEKDTLR